MFQYLFINASIIISFITLANQFFISDKNILKSSAKLMKVLLGIGAGVLGCILMIYSVKVFQSVLIDLRHIAIIIASIFGDKGIIQRQKLTIDKVISYRYDLI